MRVSVASESGRADGRNEDWAGTTAKVAVVLDGLSEAPETGCVHGTPWYVHQLGCRLLALAGGDSHSLASALAEAIREVASLHYETCDLEHPGSPCSTVVIVRQNAAEIDYLVLSDSVLVLDQVGGGKLVVTDKAVDRFSSNAARAASASGNKGDKGALFTLIQEQQKVRNRPGGYWVAQVDPAAAQHAKTGVVPDVRGAMLLSDGAALLATDFRTHDWPALLSVAYSEGPAKIIAMTREMEDQDPEGVKWPRYKHRDDATAVVCRM